MSSRPDGTDPAAHPTADASTYARAAARAADRVIDTYSTSFGSSTRLLDEPVRTRVRSIYALVRVADEIVDGAAEGAGLNPEAVREALDEYETRTEAAMATGFSTDLVVHAFALTARACGITPELTRPFFASMRADLSVTRHDAESFDSYVHGSAEVVGLMCLHAFTTDRSPAPVPPSEDLLEGARRLGAAFQKVNFLRDLRADADGRGRSYFPGVDPATLGEQEKVALLDDIDSDLAVARQVIGQLPVSSRTAVLAVHDLFAALSARLRRTPAADLRSRRIRVPDPHKAAILAGALARTRLRLPRKESSWPA